MSNINKIIRKNSSSILLVIIYASLCYPWIFPFSPPIQVGEKAQSWYNLIDSLPDDATVVLGIDTGIAAWLPQDQGAVEATITHVFSKSGKVIIVGFSRDSPQIYRLFEQTYERVLKNKEYGVDYAFLGFIPGDETAIASIASDIRATISTDYEGNPIDSLPILDDVNSAVDWDIYIDVSGSVTTSEAKIRQVNTVYGTLMGTVGAGGQFLEPYYPTQIKGLLYPNPGASAEYEKLLNAPASASARMGILYITGVLLFGVFFVAGIGRLVEPYLSKGGQ